MKYPKFIKENDKIGVPAPSAGPEDEKKLKKWLYAKKYWESKNFQIEFSKNAKNNLRGRSAPAKIRAQELNEMFERTDINSIICAGGGDFLVEILPYIDFSLLEKNPKWISGFSDPTGILYPITTNYDIATIYGQNFSSFGMQPLHKSQQDFMNIIMGKCLEEESYALYESTYHETNTGLEGYQLTDKVNWKTLNNKKVDIQGRIIGGCFDIISELAGTKYDGFYKFQEKYKNDGIIWYFDNCEITMEETIRTLWKMKELNYFKNTKGIIFGRFGVETTCYGYTTKSCLEDSILKELNIPIIYDADISHKSPCLTMINGSIAHIIVQNGKGKISFELK